MSEKMSDGELNERLAKALGWKAIRDPDYVFWEIPGKHDLVRRSEFFPAASVDDLRDYVLPEIERRGLWDELVAELALPWMNDAPDMRWEAFMLTASPSVLAAAALKVLRREE